MTPRVATLFAALLVAAVAAFFWSRPDVAAPGVLAPPVAPVAAADPSATPTPSASPTTPVPTAERGPAPGQRTLIPRRTVARTGTAGAEPPAPDDEAADPDGPVDRRPNPPADAAAVGKAIRDRMDGVRDDIGACLEGWMEADPGLRGEVMLGFTMDADGLQEAWVEDHSEVPFGPLSCFGAAVYEVDWSGITSEPIQVTFPFTFDAGEDGTAAP